LVIGSDRVVGRGEFGAQAPAMKRRFRIVGQDFKPGGKAFNNRQIIVDLLADSGYWLFNIGLRNRPLRPGLKKRARA
jgi:hypothetical protein